MSAFRNALRVGLILFGIPIIANALTFEEWQSANFTYEQIWEEGIAEPTADPDGDGIANLLEFVFSGNPQANESGLSPVVGVVGDTLTLTYRERHEMSDVSIRLQGTDTLMNWITYNNVVEADRESFTDYDEVTLLDPQPFAARRFLRLRTEFTPASTLRAASQLALKLVTPSSWAINWTDPNVTESGYAFERKLISTGQWERLGNISSDTTAWTHAMANYQASLTYRVVTLGDGSQEIASAPISLPDTDGDGIPDALELGTSFTGTAGTYATDANHFSSNESGVSDGWLVSNGFDPMGSFTGELDSDGDGVSDGEEARRGTNPHDTDSDHDNVPDGEDGWPRHAWITNPPLPEVRYAVVRLVSFGWPQSRNAIALDDQANVLSGPVFRYGKTHHEFWRASDAQLLDTWEYSYAGATTAIKMGRNGHVVGYTQPSGTYESRAVVWTNTATEPTWLDTTPNGTSPSRHDSYAYAVNGVGQAVGWMEKSSADTYDHGGAKFGSGAPSWLGNESLSTTGKSYEPVAINESGWIAAYRRFDFYDPFSIERSPGVLIEDTFHPLGEGIISGLSSGTPAVAIGRADETDADIWWARFDQVSADFVREPLDVWDASTQVKTRLRGDYGDWHVNDRLELVSGPALVRNGIRRSLSASLPTGWQSPSAKDINNRGVILVQALRTLNDQGLPINPQYEPTLFWPASFVIPGRTAVPQRRPLDAFTDTTSGPQVTLAPITTSNVSISNGMASVTISGEILDAPMGTIPAGQGGDITQVIVYINGVETHFKGTVTRASQPATFWAPYIDKGVIAPFTITFPARDVATIEIETTPNALGLVGRDGFNVIFEETTTAPGSIPGATYSSDLVISSPLSTTAIDSILLTDPDATIGETLVETSANSRIFVNSAKTASFTLYSSFTSGSPIASPIKGRVSGLSDLPSGSGWSHEDDEGQETAPNSQRFRFSVTRLAHPLPQTVSWQLGSVTMHTKLKETLQAPIAFAAAPASSLTLNFLEQEFELDKLTGHPDQDTAFAMTATGKPLLGFIATREADPESASTDVIREFVYYDHTSAAIVRKAIDDASGELPWSLKLGATNPIEITQKTPVKRLRLVDGSGTELPGFLPIEIENITAFLDGEDGVTLDESAEFYLELSGYQPGEVVRVFSTGAADDHFDLVIPGHDPLIEPNATKHTVLTAVSSGVYRTTEKVIVYSTPTDATQRLSASDWADLKALGYVAVHNDDIIIKTGEDLSRWLAANNLTSIHPSADAVLGITSQSGSVDPKLFRFDGFQDHHVFNAYHDNAPKAARWNKIFDSGWKKVFGEDFDVDEFTVPVHTKTHSKMTKAITTRWETFLDEYFDLDGNLKPGVNIPDLRSKTMDKMYSICDEFQIDTSKMRIWPRVLKDRLPTDTLYKRLVASQGQLGSSLNKLTQIKQTAYKYASASVKAAAKQRTVQEIKAVAKRVGRSKAVKLLPVVSVVLTATSTAQAVINYNELGWEEALAQQVNNELALNDLELAREFVNSKFSHSYIAGGTPRISIPINSTQILTLGYRTFTCEDAHGDITSVIPYTVVEIKVFPDGARKVALVREDRPDEVEYLDNPSWMIDNYWPAVGDSYSLYYEAMLDARSKK